MDGSVLQAKMWKMKEMVEAIEAENVEKERMVEAKKLIILAIKSEDRISFSVCLYSICTLYS
jgi:hypothetical protein